MRFLPVDTVKVDRSLIAGIDTSPRAQAIVAALVGLAHELDVQLVVEGVETGAEARTLQRLGRDRAQGHRFAHAMDATDLVDLLRERGVRQPSEAGQ